MFPYPPPTVPTLPPGPWNDEPNSLEFTASTYPCAIIRTDLGHLCGYVAVPNSHPLARQSEPYLLPDGTTGYSPLQAHGGITYQKSGGDVTWFGFDCAHYNDASPLRPDRKGTYRDLPYVRAQVESLASQLFHFSLAYPTPQGFTYLLDDLSSTVVTVESILATGHLSGQELTPHMRTYFTQKLPAAKFNLNILRKAKETIYGS